MNRNNHPSHEETLIRQFIQEQSHRPGKDEWFTRRVVNKLPHAPRQSSSSRTIMTVVTLVAVIMCCGVLWHLSHDFLPLQENILTGELLCMYITIMSITLLVVLQVIQLIKTYF